MVIAAILAACGESKVVNYGGDTFYVPKRFFLHSGHDGQDFDLIVSVEPSYLAKFIHRSAIELRSSHIQLHIMSSRRELMDYSSLKMAVPEPMALCAAEGCIRRRPDSFFYQVMTSGNAYIVFRSSPKPEDDLSKIYIGTCLVITDHQICKIPFKFHEYQIMMSLNGSDVKFSDDIIAATMAMLEDWKKPLVY